MLIVFVCWPEANGQLKRKYNKKKMDGEKQGRARPGHPFKPLESISVINGYE